MRNMEDHVRQFLGAADRLIETHVDEWSLNYNVEMEVLNHLLRVRIQDGTISQYLPLLHALCSIQHADGGWGDTRDEQESKVRTTAFSTQMLLRANRVLADSTMAQSVERGLHFIVARQQEDGSWQDQSWPVWDATSVPTGTLIFAARGPFATQVQRAALDNAIRFIIGHQQPDGGWYYKATSYPIDTTAHLLQKCILVNAPQDVITSGIDFLLRTQDPVGHWDRGNIDHTCDAARCLMLSASNEQARPFAERIAHSCHRAMVWLLSSVSDGGLGTHPGEKPNVLYTCDGLDMALKYLTYVGQQSASLMPAYYR